MAQVVNSHNNFLGRTVMPGFTGITHDSTLTGDGTEKEPLGAIIPEVNIQTDTTLTGNGIQTLLGVADVWSGITTTGYVTGNGKDTPVGLDLENKDINLGTGSISFTDELGTETVNVTNIRNWNNTVGDLTVHTDSNLSGNGVNNLLGLSDNITIGDMNIQPSGITFTKVRPDQTVYTAECNYTSQKNFEWMKDYHKVPNIFDYKLVTSFEATSFDLIVPLYPYYSSPHGYDTWYVQTKLLLDMPYNIKWYLVQHWSSIVTEGETGYSVMDFDYNTPGNNKIINLHGFTMGAANSRSTLGVYVSASYQENPLGYTAEIKDQTGMYLQTHRQWTESPFI